MNLSKYINENIDKIIDNYLDDNNEEIYFQNKKSNITIDKESNITIDGNKSKINELYEQLYEKDIINNNENHDKNHNENKITNNNENHDENNEEDYISELYEKLYENKTNPNNNIPSENKIDDGLYYIYLINIFMKYYNNKFEKLGNFFDGISDNNKDTSTAMELFFESIIEFKQLKEKIDLENNDLYLKYYFDELNRDKIKMLFDTCENQIYCLEIQKNKIFSPSLLICLNYIFENNLMENDDWRIYNMKDL